MRLKTGSRFYKLLALQTARLSKTINSSNLLNELEKLINTEPLIKALKDFGILITKDTSTIITFIGQGDFKYTYSVECYDENKNHYKIALKFLKKIDPNIQEIECFRAETLYLKEVKKYGLAADTTNIYELEIKIPNTEIILKSYFTVSEFINGYTVGTTITRSLASLTITEDKESTYIAQNQLINIIKTYLNSLGQLFACKAKASNPDGLLFAQTILDTNYENLMTINNNPEQLPEIAILIDSGQTAQKSLFDYIYKIIKRIELDNRINAKYKNSLHHFDDKAWENFFKGINKQLTTENQQSYIKSLQDAFIRLPSSPLGNSVKIQIINILRTTNKHAEYTLYIKNPDAIPKAPNISIKTLPRHHVDPSMYFSLLSRAEVQNYQMRFCDTVNLPEQLLQKPFIQDKTIFFSLTCLKTIADQYQKLNPEQFNNYLDTIYGLSVAKQYSN